MATWFIVLFGISTVAWIVVGLVKGTAGQPWADTYRPRALKAAMWLFIGFLVTAIVFGVSQWVFHLEFPWWSILGGWLVVAALVALAVFLILGLATVVKILAWAIPVLGVATLVFLGLSAFGVLPSSDRAAAPPAETAALTAEQVSSMIQSNNEKLLTEIKNLIPTAAPAEPPAEDPAADPTPPVAPVADQPAANNGAQPGNDSLVSVCDFTTQNAKDATKVDVQRLGTEVCAWTWRAVPEATVSAVCPENMVCTLHLSDDRKVVVQGDGKSYDIVAGTFRIWSAYPLDDAVRDSCRLLAKEQAFGAAEVPSFTVEAGNFTCP